MRGREIVMWITLLIMKLLTIIISYYRFTVEPYSREYIFSLSKYCDMPHNMLEKNVSMQYRFRNPIACKYM